MLNEYNSKNLYHLGFNPEDYCAEYAIVPGDPDRTEIIASYLKSPKLVASKREFKTYIGTIGDKRVFVCSTGIGGPSTAIAVEELILAGVKNFIRIGTCGGISSTVNGGDIVVATAAVRQEGTALHYAPIEFPAAADFDITLALVNSAKSNNATFKSGIVQSKDSFYGQHSLEDSPVAYELLNKWSSWKKLGVLASEMECATLFTVAAAKGVRAGAVLSVVWNQEIEDCKKSFSTDSVIKIAVDAINML